jgi:capsular exopolysaccharide synthesis family protein
MTPNGKGLTSVVAGKMSLDEAIIPTRISNLNILTSGPAVSNPAEVIDSESFAQVLKQLTDEYDRVIVDSPAVLAVTDAQILASRCDGTVLVIRAQASSRNSACWLVTRLAAWTPVWAWSNDVQFKGEDYGCCGRMTTVAMPTAANV